MKNQLENWRESIQSLYICDVHGKGGGGGIKKERGKPLGCVINIGGRGGQWGSMGLSGGGEIEGTAMMTHLGVRGGRLRSEGSPSENRNPISRRSAEGAS